MECKLHIGTEKTATTTLQNLLFMNKEQLLINNILYPVSLGKTNHRKLPIAAYDLNRRDEFTSRHKINTNKELEIFQDKIINGLEKEIDNSIKTHNNLTLLVSSEHIQSRLTTIDEIENLKNILKRLGFDKFSIIIYLRNPVELATSLYSTSIKVGNINDKPPEPDNQYFANICNHKETLIRFKKVFGEHSLVPRLFNKSEFINGSIIEDFIHSLKIDINIFKNYPEIFNESLSDMGLELLRRINKFLPREKNFRSKIIRGDLVKYFEKYYSEEKYLMHKELAEKYEKKFQESNEWIRTNYFPDKEYLYPETQYITDSQKLLSNDELVKIARLIANIWMDKQKEIINLRKKDNNNNDK